jgi:hypothetical protein
MSNENSYSILVFHSSCMIRSIVRVFGGKLQDSDQRIQDLDSSQSRANEVIDID